MINFFKANYRIVVMWITFSTLWFLLLFLSSHFHFVAFVPYLLYGILISLTGALSYFAYKKPLYKNRQMLGLLIVLFAIGFYCLFTYNKSFPLSEGWYTFYAQMIQKGRVPYIDYQLLFTPFYTYLIFFYTAIFGTKIIFLRIFGTFILLGIAITIYKIISLFVDSILASILGLTCLFLMQSNNTAAIYYDYIFVYNFFNIFGLYCLLRFFVSFFYRHFTKRNIIMLFASGCSFGFALLTRQSSGLINLLFTIILIIYILVIKNKKSTIKALIVYGIGLLASFITMLLVLLIQGNVVEAIRSSFFTVVSAKGGVAVELFNWIGPTFTVETAFYAVVFIVVIVSPFIFFSVCNNSNAASPLFLLLFPIVIVIFISLNLYNYGSLSFFKNIDSWPYVNSLFFFSFIMFFLISFYLLYLAIFKKEISKNLILLESLSGFIFFTQFGSCTSGGTSEGQGALSIALLFICYDITRRKISPFRYYKVISASLASIFAIGCMTKVVDRSYVWWGYELPSYRDQTQFLDGDILDGMKGNEHEKNMLINLSLDFANNYQEGDTVYSFCRFPITYSYLDIIPMDGIQVYVPWFDICTQDVLQQDFDLLQNNQPNIVILEQMPNWVMSGHENSFNGGKISVQRNILQYFNNLIADGTYSVVNSYNINEGLGSSYYIDLLVHN